MTKPCDICGREMVNAATAQIGIYSKREDWFCLYEDQHKIAVLERELAEAKADFDKPALSCLCCGASMSDKGRYAAVQHLVFKGVVICQECKGSSEYYRDVLGKYHLADKTLIAIRYERDEARSQLREAQERELALREALEKAAPFFDQFKIKPGIGPQTVGAEAWVGHFVMSGFALGEIQEAIGNAVHGTSATAQQIVERIKREGEDRVIALVCSQGHEAEVFVPHLGAPYFRESSLRAVLGERNP